MSDVKLRICSGDYNSIVGSPTNICYQHYCPLRFCTLCRYRSKPIIIGYWFLGPECPTCIECGMYTHVQYYIFVHNVYTIFNIYFRSLLCKKLFKWRFQRDRRREGWLGSLGWNFWTIYGGQKPSTCRNRVLVPARQSWNFWTIYGG